MQTDRKGRDPGPIYYKIQTALQKRIESGDWVPGDTLPPESKMAEDFGVSLGTIRKAILNLVAEGFLFRVQGKGTIVSGTTIIREDLRYYRFQKQLDGWEAVLKIEHLQTSIVPANKSINRMLKIAEGEELLLVRRRYFSQKKPLIYSVSYLPYRQFQSFEKLSKKPIEKVPLYKFIESQYGLPTLSNQELLGVELANEDVAEVLKISKGSPVLAIEMLAYTHRKRPYEYRHTYCLTDTHRINRKY